MKQKTRPKFMKPNDYLLYFSISFVFSYIIISIPAQAQVTPDNSLPLPTEVIKSDRLFEILGGTEAGINLFHSFAEFSVEEGNIARFPNNNPDIQNVIGRVTGASAFFSIANGAVINTETENFGSGGNINVNANTFEALRGGQLISTANSSGNAGSITVNATGLVTLSGSDSTVAARSAQFGTVVSNIGAGSGFFTRSNGSGTAGNVTINSPQLTVREGAEISAASIFAQGGDIALQGLDTLEINNSNISASTESGRAGNLTVTANESIKLDSIGKLLLEATEGGTAGNLNIETSQMSVFDGAKVSVSSLEGQAGNLTINADSLSLNQGSITAETSQTGGEAGANINLQISDLLKLENNSQISATANGLADGGNIDIDAGFVIAFPNQNSNIIARAEAGTGGNVNIVTNNIFFWY